MFKKIKMFSGQEFIVSEDEAKNVGNNFKAETLIGLKSGEIINPKGIESISDYITEEWNGYEIYSERSGRKYFMRDGNKIYLERQQLKEIKKIKIEDKKLIN